MAFMSEVANLLLCTPFDNKSAVESDIISQLSIEEFMSECYSKPQFMREINLEEESENKDSSEYKTKLEELQYSIYKQNREFKNFDIWLNNFFNFKVYILNGHAGTGKTTYINYLKYSMSDKVEWVILDFTFANNSITWFGDEKLIIDSEKFVSAYRKAYASILIAIRNLIFGYYDAYQQYSIDKIYNALCHLDEFYQKRYLLKYPAGHSFFSELHTTLNKEIIDNKVEKIIQVAQYCKKYFEKLEDIDNPNEIIQHSLDVLLLLLRCSYGEEKQFIITFDNIERFIAKEEIYNQDVVDFRKNVISYSASINEIGKVHRGIFKFLIVVRTSTESMSDPKIQSLDELSARIDISDWFDIDDIITRKIDWLKSLNIENKDIQLVEQIIGDLRVCSDKTITGLKLLIDPLLNNNTRLIIDFIGVIVESLKNHESINKYNKYWREQTSLSKFAARSIIRGLMLYQLKNCDNLFMHLKTYTNNSNDSGLGMTRKILTILYNHMLNTRNAYMSLDKIMKDLFCVNDINTFWSKKDKTQTKKDIAEVLFYMDSYSRRDNDWIQFIDLQYSNSGKSVIIESKNELYEMISNNLQDFSAKIMPGGIAYLKYIVASYEYFSMRYSKDGEYYPLFDLIPEPDTIKKCFNIRELNCVKNILFVQNKAQQCIRILGEEDPSFKLYTDAGKGYSHKERIKMQHKDYINLFVSYIEEKYCDNDNISDDIKVKYMELVSYINSIKRRYY